MELEDLARRDGVLRTSWFFLLTFALTWAAWAAAAPGRSGLFGVGRPIFLLGVFAPAIVSLALTARAEGAAGARQLLARIGCWQVDARWYGFAIGYLAGVKLTAALVHRMMRGVWPPFGDTPVPLMFAAILVSTWVQAGEELGWRGYALPRLAQRLGLGVASVLVGVVWAVWHLPLFFLPGTGSDGQSFPIYLLHVTALSVAMSWLYWRTGGSLLLVMLMHASVNNTTNIVPAGVPGAANPFAFSGSPVAWITVGLSWAIAAPLLWQMRGAEIGAMLNESARSAHAVGRVDARNR
jgi:membrane protease YdiL (CAAX protease family)